MIPLMGFCQLALFGGYAIYFPELFPTRLRSTGTSFCYNVGRLVAAAGPSVLGLLTSKVYGVYGRSTPTAVPLRGRHHVRRLPDRPARPAVRPRDEGQAAAGVSRFFFPGFSAPGGLEGPHQRFAEGLLVELGSRRTPAIFDQNRPTP